MGQAAELYACVRVRVHYFAHFMVMLSCCTVEKDKGPRTNTLPLVCATLLPASYFSFCDYGLFRNNAAILMTIFGDTEASKRLSKDGALQQYEMIKDLSALLLFSASTGGNKRLSVSSSSVSQPNVNVLNLLWKCKRNTYGFYERSF